MYYQSLAQKGIFLFFSMPKIFNVLISQYAYFSFLRHSITALKGTGILTGFPSTSPLGLFLGPD